MKTITLSVSRNEILYDVNNISFVTSDLMEQGEAKHQVADVGQKGNVDWATRIMNLSFREVVEALYPFAKTAVEDGYTKDDTFTENSTYSVELNVVDDFSQTTADLIVELIHNFMVYRILYEWFIITSPDRAKEWETKYLETLRDIRNKLNNRTGVTRRKLSPW